MYKNIFYFILLLVVVQLQTTVAKDSIRVYQTNVLEIRAIRQIPLFDFKSYGTGYDSDLLKKDGNMLIRRGLNFTQDVYSEGFRRGDIKMTIDGEQYHTACPNRMDSPASRINPLEMQSVEISKFSSQQGAGLYGKIDYHRKQYDDNFRIGAFVTANTISQQDYDASAMLSYLNNGFTIRYSTGMPYRDGSGKSFKELYNYKEDFNYKNISLSFRGNKSDFSYGISFNKLNDLSFPYLQMDEIDSKLFNGYFSYKGNKIYFNYTDHLMDNTLRKSTMFMESHAKNYTLGALGEFYEVYYRNWNADNYMRMQPDNMMPMEITNNMLPDINQLYAGLNYNYDLNPIKLAARLSSIYFSINNKEALELYRRLYSDASDNKFYMTGALNAYYGSELTDFLKMAVSGEIAFDTPEAEQLFINVQRLMKNPNWVGNPTLKQPIRTGIRAVFDTEYLRVEGYLNHVNNFVYINSTILGEKPYQSFENIDALITGVNLQAKILFLESSISFLYGENLHKKTPLAEISPLGVTNKLILPEIYGLKCWITHSYENTQKRVDAYLKESQSEAWNILGLSFIYDFNNFRIRLDAENILDHHYSPYLSFVRNPFSSGNRVYEPGRSLRLTMIYDKIFDN